MFINSLLLLLNSVFVSFTTRCRNQIDIYSIMIASFECMIFLDYWGINPLVPRTLYNKLKLFLNTTIIVLDLFDIALEILWNWQSLYITLGGAVEITSSILQCVTKVIVLLTCRKQYQKLFETVQTFWDIEKVDPSLSKVIKRHHHVVKMSIRAYIGSMLVTGIVYYGRPFIMGKRFLPLRMYEVCSIQDTLCYIGHYIFQLITIVTISTGFIGFDGLFLIFMTYAYCEIKLINNALENLDLEEDIQEDDEIIRNISVIALHHDRVLKFISDINSVYSLQLMIQFISFTSMICFGLFLVLASGFPPDMERVFKCSSYIVVYLLQLVFYCSMGTAIIHQTLSVGDAVYNSNWWKKCEKRVGRGIVMVIRRSQKSEKITIGGFADLNLSSFLLVLKTTYSFVALMQTVVQQQ